MFPNGINPKEIHVFNIMLSIELCKKVLNKKNKNYSSEQAKVIRDHLYKIALLIDEVNSKEHEYS